MLQCLSMSPKTQKLGYKDRRYVTWWRDIFWQSYLRRTTFRLFVCKKTLFVHVVVPWVWLGAHPERVYIAFCLWFTLIFNGASLGCKKWPPPIWLHYKAVKMLPCQSSASRSVLLLVNLEFSSTMLLVSFFWSGLLLVSFVVGQFCSRSILNFGQGVLIFYCGFTSDH